MLNSDNIYEKALAAEAISMAAKAAGLPGATAEAFSNIGQVATKAGNYNAGLLGSANPSAQTQAAKVSADVTEKIKEGEDRVLDSNAHTVDEAQVRRSGAAAATDRGKVERTITNKFNADENLIKEHGQKNVDLFEAEGRAEVGEKAGGSFTSPAAMVVGGGSGVKKAASNYGKALRSALQGDKEGALKNLGDVARNLHATPSQSMQEDVLKRHGLNNENPSPPQTPKQPDKK